MSRRGENIYKRKDGRWEGRYKSGYKSDGSTKYKSVYGKSYKEVKYILNKLKTENKKQVVSCSATFQEIAQLWIEHIRLCSKESTYASYMFKLKKHIYPVFSHIKYENLTAEKLNSFVKLKISCGLSSKYVCDIIGVIRAICRYANKYYNYDDKSSLISMPKYEEKSNKKLLTDLERSSLHKYFMQNFSRSNMGILLSSVTGIRLGELCALKWNDVDLDKGIICIRKTMQRIKTFTLGNATKITVTSPKSKSSIREIPLPKFIIPMLKKIRTDNENYILSGSDKITEPRTMQYRFKSILKRLNLPAVSFHSLRHGFATRAAALGFDVKTLSEILGHSSVMITMNKYVHSSMERKSECMQLISF